jgi:hypothetical protein
MIKVKDFSEWEHWGGQTEALKKLNAWISEKNPDIVAMSGPSREFVRGTNGAADAWLVSLNVLYKEADDSRD